MTSTNTELTPEEIRQIRIRLGLSQVEAGELLGGGPRAFTKYENGSTKPSASVTNLLRVLEANPSSLSTLIGRKNTPTDASEVRPFEVTKFHISALKERKFTALLRRLLSAEAKAYNLPMEGLHVAANITSPDGGEDGRITWSNGPERTVFLKGRFNQFQLKAGKITPSEAAADILTKTHDVKEMVRNAIAVGGNYTMLSTHDYNQKEIKNREDQLKKALKERDINFKDDQIAFMEGSQIASWVNIYPYVATWVLEQTQPGAINCFRTWSHWAGRAEHENSPLVTDKRLLNLHFPLRDAISSPRSAIRITGYSGVGKSRLVLEVLRPTDEEENSNLYLSDYVLYAIECETSPYIIKNSVQNLADSGIRAIIVVDRCTPETHDDLAAMVKRSCSKLSLITIDDERPSNLSPNTFEVPLADSTVIEAIISQSSDFSREDQRRLVKFSAGYPKIAILLRQSWDQHKSIANATDEVLVKSFILGRRSQEQGIILKAAMILSVFGLVGIEDSLDRDLAIIASIDHHLTEDDLRTVIDKLLKQGAAQRLGRSVILQPRPIALHLAEIQWRQWSKDRWDEILSGEQTSNLKIRASQQLALLNTTDIAKKVVQHVCRLNGPFAFLESLTKEHHAEVLYSLAQVDAEAVVALLEKMLTNIDLATIEGGLRRHIVRTLEKIAFQPSTFEQAARLLLALAIVENETWGNNATELFKKLFPVRLGNTAAGSKARLNILDEALDTNNIPQLLITTDALLEGAKVDHFIRTIGAEINGSQPALTPWTPVGEAVAEYIGECLSRLMKLASRTDEVGLKVKKDLAPRLRSYATRGFIEIVEKIVTIVTKTHGNYWPEALTSLSHTLVYDKTELIPELEKRIKAQIKLLNASNFENRVRFIVTEMPWDYPSDEDLDPTTRSKCQQAAVIELVCDLLKEPQVLLRFLPQLSVGQQRMSATFGKAIAEQIEDPLSWLEPILNAAAAAPEDKRNFELLSGYLVGLVSSNKTAVESFKKSASKSQVFATALPLVCWRLGIQKSDIPLICSALEAKLLPVYHLRLWIQGRCLSKLPAKTLTPLLDLLFKLNEDSYWVGLDIIGMYANEQMDVLDKLRPYLRKIAASAEYWTNANTAHMGAYHFETLLGWILSKGRDDPDATAIALTLTRELIKTHQEGEDLVRPLLPILLSNFPEIVWSLIGQSIISDKKMTWKFEYLLGDGLSLSDRTSRFILKLPEEVLFAWCYAHPDKGSAFAATVIPILTRSNTEDNNELELHPLMKRLLDEFGEKSDVLNNITSNIYRFGWSGSLTTYYALYKKPLEELLHHSKVQVRRWAHKMLQQLKSHIKEAQINDEEQEATLEL